ncbi:Peptidoglycan/LPS O-acetylase OafA/YrhL, contains acyltransferase and SGNH-hydrolase domains [Nonomuraea maritima]|uniref:Peptidoglycan/LPS O-acetylase OafA/YrhL, contains acyltransferase and SGNH-hydrolase domains n=1 Tax=Nonomuraea maritima TaxID=683260 RepID=A0A1G9CQB5_9ACTN|nr:acyltransferase [Nonomuraea maritima]SDK53788.1 Peptidoglycan/LPS O-acetylase OafA/YrhL, contains acyltransferase and SGNH-hydrolase domains [Nonomuraea maritima]
MHSLNQAKHARGNGRLAELDLLRFLAALAVVAFHYLVAYASVWGDRPAELFPALAPIAGLGILGVELFFIISGFVILMSVWGRGLGAFARSRLVRLYPAYWLSLAAIAALYGLTGAKPLDPKLSLGDYLVNATMFQRLFKLTDASGVYWSLWAELRFYLLISILIIIGVTYGRVLAFAGIWLAAVIGAHFLEDSLVDEIVMPAYAPYFIAGMALYLIHKRGSSWLPWIYVAAGYALSIGSALDRVHRRIDLAGFKNMPVTDTSVIITITLIYVMTSLVALGLLRLRPSRLLTALGGTTYPLYLFHSVIAVALVPLLVGDLPPWLVAVITTLAAILLSYLVYSFAERPIQRLLKPRRRPQTPTAPAAEVRKASVP